MKEILACKWSYLKAMSICSSMLGVERHCDVVNVMYEIFIYKGWVMWSELITAIRHQPNEKFQQVCIEPKQVTTILWQCNLCKFWYHKETKRTEKLIPYYGYSLMSCSLAMCQSNESEQIAHVQTICCWVETTIYSLRRTDQRIFQLQWPSIVKIKN